MFNKPAQKCSNRQRCCRALEVRETRSQEKIKGGGGGHLKKKIKRREKRKKKEKREKEERNFPKG